MKTILVVDDREENLYLLQVLLTHHGYRVDTAPDGAEALARARQSPPDLVITDILMPVMDGFALCRAWKADARLNHIPLVFYTATYTDPKDEQFAFDLGADAFIVKPAEHADFMARIQTALAATIAPAAPARAPAVAETVLLKEYDQVLVRKLEQKVMQLEASEQYSRKLFDYAPDGILIADTGSHYLDANPGICRMLGYRREELIGMHATDIVAASEFEFIQPALDTIKTRSDYQREWQFRRKDGSVFAAEVSVTTMPDGNLLAIVRDITERKQSKKALEDSRKLLQTIVETAPARIFWKDRDSRYLGCNTQFAQDAGRTRPDELTGKTDFEMGWKDQAELYRADDKATMESGNPKLTYEEPQTTPDGNMIWLRTSKVPLRDESEQIIGILGIYQDITELRQAQVLLGVQKQVLEMIATGASLPETLSVLIRHIEAQSPGMQGSILLLDEDGVHVRHGAAPSLSAEFIAAVEGQPIGPCAGSCGTAAYRKEAVFVADIATDPLWENYRAAALPHGLRACWSTPIFDARHQVLGTFAMYYHQPGLPQAEHQRLIDAATHIAAISISRHRTETVLRNSEADFRALFESSRDAITTSNIGENFLSGNPAAVALFGCRDVQEFLTLSPASASPEFQPDGRRSDEKLQEMLRLARDSGSCFFEWTHRRMDGTEFFADVLLTRTETGGKQLIQATVRDITERKQAEAELRKLSLAMEQSPNSIVIADLNANIEYVNDTFVRMSGYSHDEIIGKNPRILQSGKTPKATHQEMWAHLTRGEVWHGELINKRKDGSEYTESVIVSPMRQPDGSITNYLAIKQDITQLKRAEQDLQEQQTRLTGLIDSAMDAIVSTDENQIVILFNKAAEQIFGYRSADIIGQPLDKLLPIRFRATHSQHVEDFGRTGITARAMNAEKSHLYGLRSDGVEFPFEASISKTTITGRPVYTAILRDVTERQHSLEQLRSSTNELEEERAMLAQRVEQRTAQLQYANHAKDSFLATMSHEIRTPLGGLLGMMELLSLSHLDDRQRDMLGAAQGSGNNLLRIVNDILDWSKIEAGKLELAPHVASLAAMLEGVTKTYGQLASSKGIRLTFEIDDSLSPAHRFDPLRVSQILNNFTSNAIKFTARGTIKISAQRLGQQAGSESVRFCVADSGMGIAPEQQARLFQHYEQASADTARMYGGTGLGLAICSRLAELMEGELSVESTAGVGSTFCLTVNLPVASLAEQRALQSHLEQQAIHAEQPDIVPLLTQGRHPSILVVDDHPVNRMLLKQQLQQLGIQAEIAAHGMVALSLWQVGRFDLVITDCHMPEMDGYELARSIREIEQHEGRPRIPIIAWTANVLAEEELRCKTAGMDDMLTKPTELAQLRAMLLKWLTKPGDAAPVVSPAVASTPAAASPTATVAALDFTVLGKFVAGRATQIEMLQEFNTHNRSDIASLQTVLHGSDPAAVTQAAHRMKGACRMMGALELASLCADIEAAGRRGEMPEAEAARQLDEAVARVEAEISRFIDGQ